MALCKRPLERSAVGTLRPHLGAKLSFASGAGGRYGAKRDGGRGENLRRPISLLKGVKKMFDSIRNWLTRTDSHQADRRQLEAEARQFRLPSETLPQVFKYLFFAGLAFLNYRLFAEAVPGAWGQSTGCVAVMAEAIALYASHNFSRSAGLFRAALGLSGGLLMAFSLVHGTFSILDLIGAADISEAIEYYSRVIAFPLLAGLLGLSVISLTMTHPKNLVRLKQALAHTSIVIGRAQAASELELMRAQSIIEQARLDRQRERTRRESEYLVEIEKLIGLEERKRAMVSQISDPTLRESLAREMGIDPDGFPTMLDTDAGSRSGRNRSDLRSYAGDANNATIATQSDAERRSVATQDGLAILRDTLSDLAFSRPGRWFKVDLRSDHVLVRLNYRKQGKELTERSAKAGLDILTDATRMERNAFTERLRKFLNQKGFEL